MPNNSDENQPVTGEGNEIADESAEKELPRYAGRKHSFDEDTEGAFKLPKPTPEVTEDDDAADEKKADSSFEDQEIEIEEGEIESESQSPGRKY